ncbi:MAG: WD40 repeat domain-containing protein [Hyphomicrobium sp.]
MPTRIFALVAVCALAGQAALTSLPAHASPEKQEEAAKAVLRPICAVKPARDKVVAKMIEQGGEYERANAKWDMDMACEQIDLPTKPVHDTADPSVEASHTDWIYDARWSPDGKLIATAGRDGSVRLWDAASGKTVRTIDIMRLPPLVKLNYPGLVRAARFLGDGRQLVVTADTHPVRIFDVDSGEQVGDVPYTQSDPEWPLPPFIETSASGLVVLGGYKSDLVVYDTLTKAERYRLPGVPNDYPRFALSDTAGFLATAAPKEDNRLLIQLRQLDTGKQIWEVEADGDRSADSIAFSRDGKKLAVAVRGQAHIYDTASKNLISKVLVYPSFGTVNMTFTADGTRLIAGLRHAQLWDIATGKRIHHFGPFSDLLHSLAVSPDGKYLLTGHIGSDGRIWDIDTGTFFRRLGQNVYPRG